MLLKKITYKLSLYNQISPDSTMIMKRRMMMLIMRRMKMMRCIKDSVM